jgi:hypothetical protein
MRTAIASRAGLMGLVLLAAVLPPTQASAEPSAEPDCVAPPELVVNRWVGQTAADEVGLWTNDSNWSRGKAPGRRATKQLVCIRTSARIVIPVGAELQVHVGAIDIGSGPDGPADVVVLKSNGLYVEARPRKVKSQVRPGSRLRVKGGALGGRGLILVTGEVVLDTNEGQTGVLTTRQCGSVPAPGSCVTPPPAAKRVGTLQVTGGGRFRVNHGVTLVTDGYDVIVAGGQLLFQGTGGRVVADNGTSLTLRQARGATEASTPTLVFDNDGGWYVGSDPFGLPVTEVALNRAVIAKEMGEGTSSIQGSVTARNEVRAHVTSGSLAIAGNRLGAVTTTLQPASTYTSGTCTLDPDPAKGCTPEATTSDVLVTSIKLPGAADDAAQVIVEEVRTDATALRAGTKIRSAGLDVSRDDPVLLELRLDASAVGGRTPATAEVAVGSSGTYQNLGDCTASGAVPDPVARCVDRRPGQSRFETDGDLVMVVRILHSSRYIIR